jgi:hypothetical protein
MTGTLEHRFRFIMGEPPDESKRSSTDYERVKLAPTKVLWKGMPNRCGSAPCTYFVLTNSKNA